MTRPVVAIVAAGPDVAGGQGVQARALVEGLRGDGYVVSFIPIKPRFPTGLAWLRRHRYARTLVNQALFVSSLRRLRHVDVVHVFSASYWSFLLSALPPVLVGRALGKRVVLHYHSGEAEDHLARWGRLVHPWLHRVDALVVPSEYLRGIFARHGYAAHVVPNVVDTSRFAYRPRIPLRARLLSARNLEPYYRVDVILDALALLQGSVDDPSLVVAGAGTEAARLEQHATARGVPARFLGAVDASRMPHVYDAADIFLNASVVDNQPVSILEAFASGLPVVSTPTGDIGAMVREGETGIIVPPDDPAALAKAVTGLLGDPERARDLAQRARDDVDRFTWRRVRGAWADVYAGARR